MYEIKRAAVIGAGTMGLGIAGQLALTCRLKARIATQFANAP
jgi:3-hydroxyacyl-CoA dehydrogenase